VTDGPPSESGEDSMTAKSSHRELARRLVGAGSIKVGNTVLTFAVSVLLARSLGPEGFGKYSFALSVVALLGTLAHAGLPVLLLREVARYHFQHQWNLLKGVIRSANYATLVISLMVVLIAFAIVSQWPSDAYEPPSGDFLTFGIALTLVPLMAFGALRGATLRALHELVRGQAPEFVLRPLFLATFLLFATSIDSLTVPNAVGLHAAAALITFLISSWIVRAVMPHEASAASPSYELRRWATSAFPFAVLYAVQVLNAQIGITALGFLATDEEVGRFRVALQCSQLASFALAAMNMALAADIPRLHAAGDKQRLQAILSRSSKLVLLTTVPVTALMIAFGRELLEGIFGESFVPAHSALVVLCVGHTVAAAIGSVNLLLNMTGHERDTAMAFGMAATLNVALCIGAIPVFGVLGAAVASSTAQVLWTVLLHHKADQRLGIRAFAFGRRGSGAP
jgi:O-antigen/teichoic acid export membrane protein